MTVTGDKDQEIVSGELPGAFGMASAQPGSARAIVEEMVDAGLLDHLMAGVGEGGLSLTGEGGAGKPSRPVQSVVPYVHLEPVSNGFWQPRPIWVVPGLAGEMNPGTEPVMLRNTGTAPVRLGEATVVVELNGGQVVVEEQSCADAELAPGEQCELGLAMISPGVGWRTGAIAFNSPDLLLGISAWLPLDGYAMAAPTIIWSAGAFDGVALASSTPVLSLSSFGDLHWWRQLDGSDMWESACCQRLNGELLVDASLPADTSASYRVELRNSAGSSFSDPVIVARGGDPGPTEETVAYSVRHTGFVCSAISETANPAWSGRPNVSHLSVGGTSITVSPRMPDGPGHYTLNPPFGIRARLDPNGPEAPLCGGGTLTVRDSVTRIDGSIHRLDASIVCETSSFWNAVRAEIRVGYPWLDEPLRDYDGDFYTDFFARHPINNGNAAELYLVPGLGDGEHWNPQLVFIGDTGRVDWDRYTALFGVGDLDGDARADVIGRDSDGFLYLFSGEGNSKLKPEGRIGTSKSWNNYTAFVGVGDFTGNGNVDVIARGKSGALYVFPGRGDGTLSARQQIGTSTSWNDYTDLFS